MIWGSHGYTLSLMIWFVLVFTGLFSPVIPAACAETRLTVYVDDSSSGYQDGTPEYPFATIAQALGTAADEIRVAEGTYSESVTLYDALVLRGGYESAGWTRDWQAHTTLIVGQGEQAISGSGVNNVEISGFHVTGTAAVTHTGIFVTPATGMVFILSNEIYGLDGPPGEDGDICVFSPDCPEIHGKPAPEVYGILMSGATSMVIGNVVHDLAAGSGGSGGYWELQQAIRPVVRAVVAAACTGSFPEAR